MKLSARMLQIMLAFVIVAVSVVGPQQANANTNDKIRQIEQFVEQQRNAGRIPGISLVIVEKGKTVYQQGFGYADVKTKQPVTGATSFEIGSTTKAFTGLAILQLEREGRLKRTDDIRKYIPWLELTYNGEPQAITIDQLLHHTSGIASNTITLIPESDAANALESTVQMLTSQPLNRKPGSSFEYATINYDVLGLVIEMVTKKPYDVYMKEHILEPIGMNESFVGLHQVQATEMAAGYKIGWMKARGYTPPVYRGNIPAGYIVSNTNDIAKWLNVQLGTAPSHAVDQRLINESHIPDQTVEPFDENTYYAAGWGIQQNNGKTYVLHAGENPTFSSYFIMRPDEQLGVAVLANMKTGYTTAIGQGVMGLWEGRSASQPHSDSFQELDRIVTLLSIAVVVFGALFLGLTLGLVRKLARNQRHWTRLTGKRLPLFILHLLLVAASSALVISAPNLLLGGLPWAFIQVWAPASIPLFFSIVLAVCVIYLVFGSLLAFTKKTKAS